MTATTTSAPKASIVITGEAKPPRDKPVSIGSLTRVELRKATDTRAGKWLIAVIVLIGLATLGLSSFLGEAENHTFKDVLTNGASATSLLLPVLGVLLVTSEWSQNTAATTFTLVPRRGRVVVAKVAAGLLLGVTASLVVAGVAAACAAVAPQAPSAEVWDGAAALVARSVLFQALMVTMGVGFGAVFLNSPIAIVVYFVLPTVWTVLTGVVSALKSVQEWADVSTASLRLFEVTVPAEQWAQLAVASVIWVAVPLAVGSARISRKPI